MKTIRKSLPQVYEYDKAGNTYFEVSARSKRYGLHFRKNFPSRKEALEYAQQVEDDIIAKGRNALDKVIETTDKETQALIDKLRPFNRTLKEAVEHYIGWLGEQAKENLIPYITSLVDRWEREKLESKINPLAKRTQTELKSYANWLRYNLGKQKPSQVNRVAIVKLLDGLNTANRTRKQYLRYIRMFFIWAKNEGYTNSNPTDGIKIHTPAYEADFYTPQETETLLRLVQKEYPTMRGYYTLAVFAGLRPSECLRVQWQDISQKTGEIYVRKGKKEARRFILHPTAIKRLENLDRKAPLIPMKNTANLNRQIREDFTAQTGKPWIQDGLRHGFATYFNSLKADGGYATANCLGDDLRTVKRHYMRAVPKEDMEHFWRLV